MIQVNPRGKKTKFSSSFYTHFRERTDNKYVVQFKVRPTPRRYKSTVRWTRTRFPTLSRYGTRPCLDYMKRRHMYLCFIIHFKPNFISILKTKTSPIYHLTNSPYLLRPRHWRWLFKHEYCLILEDWDVLKSIKSRVYT